MGLGSNFTSVHPPPLVLAFPLETPAPPGARPLGVSGLLLGIVRGAGAVAMDPALLEAMEAVGHTPIKASEVQRAAATMASGKSTALG